MTISLKGVRVRLRLTRATQAAQVGFGRVFSDPPFSSKILHVFRMNFGLGTTIDKGVVGREGLEIKAAIKTRILSLPAA
jgi:16S rRNA G966 N2-methylase RsmD